MQLGTKPSFWNYKHDIFNIKFANDTLIGTFCRVGSHQANLPDIDLTR